MADLTPNNREEHWLKGMVDGQTTLEPNKRREYWYKEIVDAIGSGGGGGTGGGVLVVNCDPYTGALDKTWNEINNAAFAVIKTIPTSDSASFNYISGVQYTQIGDEITYQIITYSFDDISEPILFTTDNADGYPVIN